MLARVLWIMLTFSPIVLPRLSSVTAGLRRFSKLNNLKMTVGQVPVKTMPMVDCDGTHKTVYYLDKGTDDQHPPLVLIGGTAQTVDTFMPHINQIAKSRRLIIPEMRGQGRTNLDPQHCKIEQLIDDLDKVLDYICVNTIDLGGFSFGGRVVMAYCAHRPQRVRRLAVTAIPLTRPPMGKVILESWMDGLKRGHMRECAWSFVINGYSTEFLERNAERMGMYVDMVEQSNDPHKVYNLIHHSAVSMLEGPYSIPQCAAMVKCPTLVIGATHDRIAGVAHVQQLAAHMAGSEYVEMNTGHLAPFEDPVVWRKHLMEFMNR